MRVEKILSTPTGSYPYDKVRENPVASDPPMYLQIKERWGFSLGVLVKQQKLPN